MKNLILIILFFISLILLGNKDTNIIGAIIFCIIIGIFISKYSRIIEKEISIQKGIKANCRINIDLELLNIIERNEFKEYFDKGFKDYQGIYEKVKTNLSILLREGKIKEYVSFFIKGDDIYIDNNIVLDGTFLYEVFIPFELENFKEREKSNLFRGMGVIIRLVMVNGEILLQIGEFRKVEGFNLIKNNTPKIHKQYYTISRFPIMLLYPDLKIPKKILNYSIERVFLNEYKTSENNKKEWENKIIKNSEIFKLYEEIYNIDYNLFDEKLNKIYDTLVNKGKEILKENNMETDFLFGNKKYYKNEFLNIFIYNIDEYLNFYYNKENSEFKEEEFYY